MKILTTVIAGLLPMQSTVWSRALTAEETAELAK